MPVSHRHNRVRSLATIAERDEAVRSADPNTQSKSRQMAALAHNINNQAAGFVSGDYLAVAEDGMKVHKRPIV